MGELIRFSVTIPSDLLEAFDDYVSMRGVSRNRSEAIRDLIRDVLAQELVADPEAELVGSITMVYDHHHNNLKYKIDEVQHSHATEVVASMHVHLDHSNCLEVVVVRGKGKHIQEVAECLLGIKGVKQGRVSCSSIDPTEDYLNKFSL